jgi:hypothetical protein
MAMNRRIGAALAIIGSLAFATSSLADDSPPASPAPIHFPAFRFGAFADIVLSHPTGRGKDHQTGEVDLYASSQLGGDWSFLSEVLVKSSGDTTSADRPTVDRFELNLERIYVAYNPSDRLRIEIGQIHTGIIQWNGREHRSLFLQTPIDVPAIARRESQHGAWPLHFDGAWASGRVPGALGAEYGIGLGGARGTERDDIQPLFRRGISPAGLFLVSVAPDALTGFEAGTSGYVGRIRLRGQTLSELDATLFSSFVRGGIELRGEWARMVHSEVGGPNEFVTRGWYLLGSFRPRGRLKPFRPYVLLDHLNVAPGEQYLSDVLDLNAWSAGVRWDISSRWAFKSEFRSQLVPAPRARHLVRVELALAF